MQIYNDQDADLGMLKDKQIALIGYGNQGRAQALNLRDSGLQVIVGNREDSYAVQARSDGFTLLPIEEAAKRGDVIMLLIPDEIMGPVFDHDISPSLTPEKVLVFASGFNIAYGFMTPPSDVDVILVAPRMIGAGVRDLYIAGGGFPSFIGVANDHSGQARNLALALAKGIGSTRTGVVEVTFAQEAELDLFNEQCFGPAFGQVLVNAVDLLIERGYPPEAVLLELYMSGEFAYTLTKIAQMGIVEQSQLHSMTSQYGSLSKGMRFMLPDIREKMAQGLEEIRSGLFAREWAAEHEAGYPTLEGLRAAARGMPLYEMERELRSKLGTTPGHLVRGISIETHQKDEESAYERESSEKSSRVMGRLRSFVRGRGKTAPDSGGSQRVESPAPIQIEDLEPVLNEFLASLSNDAAMIEFSKSRHLIVQYRLTDIDQSFFMQFSDGHVSAKLSAPADEAQVILEATSEVFDGMFSGRINAMRAAMSGKLKFGGDTRQAMSIQKAQDDLCRLYQEARRKVER